MKENQEKKELVLLEDLGIMYPSEKAKNKYRFGLYKCYCGKEFKTQIDSVKRKLTQSCGCYSVKVHTKHKYSTHRLYSTWRDMLRRCYDERTKTYDYYGGRGIKVCERWHKIENFMEDMSGSHIDGLTLDRIDSNGNYEPSNCRWATKTEQSTNQRIRKDNKTGYVGIYKKENNKYTATVRAFGKSKYLGTFSNIMDAVITRDNFIKDNNLQNATNI